MFKALYAKNHVFNVLLEDKLCCGRGVLNLNFCKQLTTNSSPNKRISQFEVLINGEKIKAKNYFLIEDKCNALPKLNSESVSRLLDTKVNNVLKWTFNGKSCALIEINDNNYSLRRDIRRNLNLESNKSIKSSVNSLRYMCLSTFPKLLYDSSHRTKSMKENQNFVHRFNSRETLVNVNYLRESFKTNEDSLKYILSDKNVSDLDLKIRFYIINQLEQCMCHTYLKGYQILPFGSSIAGLGIPNSDLDLVLIPKQLAEDSDSKFEERKRLKDNLNYIADLLESSVPFYTNFSRILRARIPIVKFGFQLAPVDIDLSIELSQYSVHHGVYMSAFLNYCTQLHPQFRDFILLVRAWAKQHRLLKPKNWSTHLIYNGFTSFQLTSLVIFFLQKEGLVPPMKHFLSSNEPFISSKRHTNCIEMLADFFEFVLSIRFEWEGISILNVNTFPNPDSSPIYMENPFDIELNMCRNITRAKFERFLEITAVCSDKMRIQGFSLAEIFDIEKNRRTNNHIEHRIRVDDLFSEN